ncbi:unnamed protein product [Diamesa tonsa]
MISKKFYSEQLLQLVLALSLLHVDPVNYLEWGLGIPRIHTGNGGWQLEMHATPLTEFPYLNRKNYVPLIEDLARYDRINTDQQNEVQAYLLNLSDETPLSLNNNISNNNSTSNSNTTNAAVNTIVETSFLNRHNEVIVSGQQQHSAASSLVNLIQDHFQDHPNDDDVFLNTFSDNTESILDLNLADLNDYEDQQALRHSTQFMVPLPTKTEIPDVLEDLLVRDGLINSNYVDTNGLRTNGTNPEPIFTRTAIINWDDFLVVTNDTVVTIKKEDIKKELNDEENDERNTEPEHEHESVVELTTEEMDLIEVLWKQDVDLGYNPILPTLNSAPLKEAESIDDIEKLKALLELKTDKKSDKKKDDEEQDPSSMDPWAGLSYTIDTETGEYIIQTVDSGNNNELDNLLLEEALQLVDLAADELNNKKSKSEQEKESSAGVDEEATNDELETTLKNNLNIAAEASKDEIDFDLSSPLSNLLDESDELDLINEMMIQPPTTHFQHPRQPPNQNYAHCVNSYRQNGYQGRVPLSRTVSMEQRWQDLANLLSFPPGMGTSGSISQHGQFAHPLPHHHHHAHSHSAVLHNASLAEIASQPPPHHIQPYSPNLGSAVASSMHLTNSTSETDAGNSTYKMEHDLMYYSNTSSEMNHTNDGFLNSILNDEDLQLMDMAVNEGMYTMRMLDQSGNTTALGPNPQLNNALLNNPGMQTSLASGGGDGINSTVAHTGDRLDASSDSAVSSMGSERVASLSDGEWNEGGSDSAQDYHQTHHSKFGGPYDYRYNNSRMLDSNRQPVAQKKHQMFGKRFMHEQQAPLPTSTLHHPHSHIVGSELPSIPNMPLKYEPYESYAISSNLEGAAGAAASSVIKPPLNETEMKYSYSIDFPNQRHLKSGGHGNSLATHELINHNHTYTMPHPHPGGILSGATPRPQTRDKKLKKAEDEHLSRDEKRARSLHIPIPVQDIINLPMDEFNERLSKYDLSENQLSLIRDIRRRGKNKVAAQNCRKRKLDQIISLADEVKDMKMRKERFLREREIVLSDRRRVKDKFAALYRHVFQNLRDADGNPYSSYQYSLQQSADGSVVMVPRSETSSDNNPNNSSAGSSSLSRNNNSNGNGGHHPGSNQNNNNNNSQSRNPSNYK